MSDPGTRTGEIDSVGDAASRNFYQVKERNSFLHISLATVPVCPVSTPKHLQKSWFSVAEGKFQWQTVGKHISGSGGLAQLREA